jgi:hypothetical protein
MTLIAWRDTMRSGMLPHPADVISSAKAQQMPMPHKRAAVSRQEMITKRRTLSENGGK